jgi:hypothetical protein
LVILVTVISASELKANAEDCQSGHYYRMSGRCADPPARKPAVAAHPSSTRTKRLHRKAIKQRNRARHHAHAVTRLWRQKEINDHSKAWTQSMVRQGESF